MIGRALESPIVLRAVIATQLLLFYEAGALYEAPFKGLHTGAPTPYLPGRTTSSMASSQR